MESVTLNSISKTLDAKRFSRKSFINTQVSFNGKMISYVELPVDYRKRKRKNGNGARRIPKNGLEGKTPKSDYLCEEIVDIVIIN